MDALKGKMRYDKMLWMSNGMMVILGGDVGVSCFPLIVRPRTGRASIVCVCDSDRWIDGVLVHHGLKSCRRKWIIVVVWQKSLFSLRFLSYLMTCLESSQSHIHIPPSFCDDEVQPPYFPKLYKLRAPATRSKS